jgi:PAS domain S-box-containing protein
LNTLSIFGNGIAKKHMDFLNRPLFDTLNEGIIIAEFILGNNNKVSDVLILDANESIKKQTGFSSKDIVGRRASEILPKIRDNWFSWFDEIVSTSAPLHFEEYSQATSKWLEIKSIPQKRKNTFAILITDITLRKYNQRLLSDDLISSTGKLNGIAHCRIILDEKGTPYDYEILTINDNYTRLIGVTREEIEGKRVREVFPGIENFSFNYISEYGKVALNGTELNTEAYFETTRQYLSLYAFRLIPGEFIVVFTDITASKQMEVFQKLQAELLQIILNSIPVMITIYDPEIKNLQVNKEFEKCTGWTQNEISLGYPMQMIYPDAEYRNEVAEFMHNGKGWRDFKMTLKDGSKLESSWANIKLPDGRQVGIGIDITERKYAEEMIGINESIMQAFFDRSPGILNLFDQDLRYIKTDPFTPVYFNHDQKSIIGKSLYDLNPVFAEQVLQVIFKKVTGNREALLNIEVEGLIPSKNYEKGNWLVSYFPVPLPGGKDGLGVMGVDITNQKKAESALRESEESYRILANNLQHANEEIKKSLTEKDFLIKEIHHRVKNNLQIIASLLRLQMDTVANQDFKDIFIEASNRIRAISMIHEHLYSEKVGLVTSTNYIPELANLIIQSYKTENKKIELDLQITEVALKIDIAVYLGLLINEILSNSYKHAFRDKDSGKVSIHLIAHQDNEYELRISDNGLGFPPKPKIGLGKVLIETLVEQLEGKVIINNIAGIEYRISFKNQDPANDF